MSTPSDYQTFCQTCGGWFSKCFNTTLSEQCYRLDVARHATKSNELDSPTHWQYTRFQKPIVIRTKINKPNKPTRRN
jgi:hypothetical protein